MPAFKTVVPVLKVADLARSVDFYTRVLGLTVSWRAAADGDGERAEEFGIRDCNGYLLAFAEEGRP